MRKSIGSVTLVVAASIAIATAALAKDVSTELHGKGYEFAYSYPDVVNTIPALKKQLETERAESLSSLQEEAKDWLTNERSSDVDLDAQTHWKQVANLPGYLSLTADAYSYTGGAHGLYGRSSMVWDKKANRSIDPLDMFTSAAAFDRLVQTPFCDKLDIERSKKREGEKIDRSQTDDWMQACPKPSDYTVIIGSSDKAKFNRMAIYIGPYGAGPYSEGDYEIDMPVTPELLALVKPQYRPAFAVTPGKKR
jgi:Deacetylase PdaC